MVCMEANDVLPILRKQFESVTTVLHFVWTVSEFLKDTDQTEGPSAQGTAKQPENAKQSKCSIALAICSHCQTCSEYKCS